MRVENENVSRTSALLNLIAGAALLVVVNALGHGLGIPSDRFAGVSRFSPPPISGSTADGSDQPVVDACPSQAFLAVPGGAMERPLRWIELATVFWVPGFFGCSSPKRLWLRDGVPIPALENRGLRILLGQGVAVLLFVALLATLLWSWKRLRRLLEPAASGAVPAPRRERLPERARRDLGVASRERFGGISGKPSSSTSMRPKGPVFPKWEPSASPFT